MGALSKTKELCKQKNISIRTLETELGFGNGYLGSKTKDDLPFDRVVAIANYFHVPIDYFMSEKVQNVVDYAVTDKDIELAVELYERVNRLSPENQTALLTLLESLQRDSGNPHQD